MLQEFPLQAIAIVSLGFNFAMLHQSIAVHQKIAQFSICPTYGILTRQGLDRSWLKLERRFQHLAVIFFDVDHMHKANEKYGYEEVDRRIRQSLNQSRSTERVGRWYSGDEIVIICPIAESEVAARRIAAAFAENGLSVTMAIAPCTSADLELNVKTAADLVQEAKRMGDRGSIFQAKPVISFEPVRLI
jgi:GGDEF domain-containing protein